jgi:hypothetical protein
MGTGDLTTGPKRPARETDHSPSSSAKVKNVCSFTSNFPIHLHGVVLTNIPTPEGRQISKFNQVCHLYINAVSRELNDFQEADIATKKKY